MVSSLVAMIASTYLTIAISPFLASFSAAHLTLHSSHYFSLATLSALAYNNSATDYSKIFSYMTKAASAYFNLVSASDLAY
jgi:uncharacterized membrane protein